jgi:hypothetical protein
MARKYRIVLAALTAAAVVFIGANTFACGGKTRTSSLTSANGYGVAVKDASGSCPASAVCPYGSGACSSHGVKNAVLYGQPPLDQSRSWTSKVCGSKGYYAANVYLVNDGCEWAVCNGRTFEVTEATPFTQVGEARYYFADEDSRIRCAQAMQNAADRIDKETVALATADGNVVGTENGMKVARCLVSGRQFLVTADSPIRVADGKRYYLNAPVDLSTVSSSAH